MGVFLKEVEEVSQPVMKSDQRIAGFLEEERRAKQRIANGLDIPRRLPQGPYVFCDFRTLQLPGIEVCTCIKLIHPLYSFSGFESSTKHSTRKNLDLFRRSFLRVG